MAVKANRVICLLGPEGPRFGSPHRQFRCCDSGKDLEARGRRHHAGQNRCAHPKTEQEGGKEHRAVRLDIDDRQVSIRAIDGPAPTVGWIHNPYLGFAFVMTQEDVQA